MRGPAADVERGHGHASRLDGVRHRGYTAPPCSKSRKEFRILNKTSIARIADTADGEQLGEVELADREKVDRAVAGARHALARWRARSVAERAACLETAADTLAPESAELADLLSRESGKPIGQARFEVEGAIALLRGNANEGRRRAGRVLPTEGNRGTERDIAWTRREPLGVVAAILPFNFPVELLVEKCAAALVGGNAVVVKSPLEDPLAASRVHEALIASGVPPDVFALVHGGRDVGAALACHPGIDAVSLTGSTAAGADVAAATARSLRRLHLELGGNNAAIVLEDADLGLVTRELLYGRLLMNGQACSASKRVIVAAKLHDELVERLDEGLGRVRLGPAIDPDTTVGPLIHEEAAWRVAAQVSKALAQGATLAAGETEADGAFFAPVLLSDVPADADVAIDDEIFGPVFCLVKADSPAHALEIANGSSFGLMASVFTRDVQLAVAMAERLETGGVVINGTDNYRPPVIPFGGVKMSGSGREGLGYTINELTREKAIVLRRFREAGELERV